MDNINIIMRNIEYLTKNTKIYMWASLLDLAVEREEGDKRKEEKTM